VTIREREAVMDEVAMVEAVEEAKRVLANKTRSHVGAARELATAVIALEREARELEEGILFAVEEVDHWRERAFAAEACVARLKRF
jgi:hypothetical protein